MASHACYAPACDRTVPSRMLMCRPHWFALPKSLRETIWAEYRPGQESDHRPSTAYLPAVRQAQDFLREKAALS